MVAESFSIAKILVLGVLAAVLDWTQVQHTHLDRVFESYYLNKMLPRKVKSIVFRELILNKSFNGQTNRTVWNRHGNKNCSKFWGQQALVLPKTF